VVCNSSSRFISDLNRMMRHDFKICRCSLILFFGYSFTTMKLKKSASISISYLFKTRDFLPSFFAHNVSTASRGEIDFRDFEFLEVSKQSSESFCWKPSNAKRAVFLRSGNSGSLASSTSCFNEICFFVGVLR
jgi:hypothetical protein